MWTCVLVGEGSSANASPLPSLHPSTLTHTHTDPTPLLSNATDDVPSSCIFITVMVSVPAKRPATRVTSAPVSVATAILPKSARQPAHDWGQQRVAQENR